MTFGLLLGSVLSVLMVTLKIQKKGLSTKQHMLLRLGSSLLFMGLSVEGYRQAVDKPMAMLFLVGLFMSFIGDGLSVRTSNKFFLLTVGFFGLSYIAFFGAYLYGVVRNYGGVGLKDRGVALFAVIVLAMTVLFPLLRIKIPKRLLIPTAIYLVLLSLMAAMGLLYAELSGRLMFGTVALLYAFSDGSFIIGLYGKTTKITESLYLYIHYTASFLLAWLLANL